MNDYQYINENGIPRDYYEIVDENGELCKEIEILKEKNDIAIEKVKNATKEIQRLNNIINEIEDSIVGKINVLYQVRGQSNAIQELSILLKQLRELKESDIK